MKRISWVKADEWMDIDDVDEVLDVSEDIYGRDVITFEYNGKEYKSICVQGSRPG